MPICFRCGKHLTTDQGLQYHLSKKTQCDTLSCDTCKEKFENKTLLRNHQINCQSKQLLYNNAVKSRHDTYDHIISDKSYIIELNPQLNIEYISKNIYDIWGLHKNEIIGNTTLFNIDFKFTASHMNILQNKSTKSKEIQNNYIRKTKKNKCLFIWSIH